MVIVAACAAWPLADAPVTTSLGSGLLRFYVNGDAVVAAAVGENGSVGAPRRWFDRSTLLFNHRFRSYSVSPDGKRFFMIRRDPGSIPRQLNVIVNW